MKYNPVLQKQIQKYVQRLFRAKSQRRRGLAKLPFEEKILILIRLQKMAEGISSKEGKAKARVWNIRPR